MRNLVQLITALAAAATAAGAGTAPSPVCLKGQLRTQSEPHSGTVIANTLRDMVSNSTHDICSGGFPANSMMTRRSTGSLVLQATRESATASLGSTCADAFIGIINTCIEFSNFYGGNVTVGQIRYAVFNERYPAPWLSTKSNFHSHALPKSTPSDPSIPSRPVPTLPPNSIPASTLPTKGTGPRPLRASLKSMSSAVAVSLPPKKTPPAATTSVAGSNNGAVAAGAAAGGAVIGAAIGAAAVGGIVGGAGAGAGAAAAAASAVGGDAAPDTNPNRADASPTPSSLRQSRSTSTRSSSKSTPSSVSPSASPTSSIPNSIIVPKSSTGAGTDGVGAMLNETFGSDQIFTLIDADDGIDCWGVPLSPSQVKLFLANPAVETVIPDSLYEVDNLPQASTNPAPSRRSTAGNRNESAPLQKRDDLVVEIGQGWDLTAISYPPGATFDTDSYVYDRPAGQGVTVYVVGTGANPLHADFTGMAEAQSVRWLYPKGEALNRYEADFESDPLNYGTCMVSKAVGSLYGVAKRASLVVVKLPIVKGSPGKLFVSDLLASLNAIIRDILPVLRATRRGPPSVATISWNILDSQLNAPSKQLLARQFAALAKLGVIVTVPAGDDLTRNNAPINQYPATMGRELSVFVMGAVAPGGVSSLTSQVGPSLAPFAAPGALIECASNVGTMGHQIVSSTRNAAAMAAGLAAYLMSVPEYRAYTYGDASIGVAENLRGRPAKIYALMAMLAYKRAAGTVPVIWNGVAWAEDGESSCEAEIDDPATIPSTSNVPPPLRRRSACIISQASKAPPSPTPSSSSPSLPLVPPPLKSSASNPPPPPPPPASSSSPPPPPPSPIRDAAACQSSCLPSVSTCVGACVVNQISKSKTCSACLEAAGATSVCVQCLSLSLIPTDCTTKVYTPCNAASGNFQETGICSQKAFCQSAFLDGTNNPCPANQLCDVGVAPTRNCQPGGGT